MSTVVVLDDSVEDRVSISSENEETDSVDDSEMNTIDESISVDASDVLVKASGRDDDSRSETILLSTTDSELELLPDEVVISLEDPLAAWVVGSILVSDANVSVSDRVSLKGAVV